MNNDKVITGYRKLLLSSLSAIIIVLITLILGELGVRTLKYFGPSTFMFRQYDDQLGVTLIPDTHGVHRKCYDGYVSINSHGMRDKERTLEKPDGTYRIGVFSDSMIESVHVQPEETSTRILEEKLNKHPSCQGKCEVLNFAVGGYATLQNYLRYELLGSRFDLDMVMLVFTDNDLPILEDSTSGGDVDSAAHVIGNLYPTPILVNDKIIYPEKPDNTDTLSFLFRHSSLFYYIYKTYNALFSQNNWSISRVAPAWATPRPNALFLDTANPYANRAWSNTETILDKLHASTVANGSELVIVNWGYDTGSNPWYKPLDPSTLPETFVSDYASSWFRKYGSDRHVHTYDLGREIGQYIRDNALEEPYLSFSCDMHFNPDGQRVIADLIYKDLVDNNKIK